MNVVLLANRLPDMFGRQVLRCAVCQLVQFRHENPCCIRCKQLLFTDGRAFHFGDAQTASGPVVVEEPIDHDEFVRKNVKRFRQIKGFSQRQLSACLGSPRTWISKIENGKVDLTVNSLERLSAALGVSVIELISDMEIAKQRPIEQEILSDAFLVEVAPFVSKLSRRNRLVFVAKLESLSNRNKKERGGVKKAA